MNKNKKETMGNKKTKKLNLMELSNTIDFQMFLNQVTYLDNIYKRSELQGYFIST